MRLVALVLAVAGLCRASQAPLADALADLNAGRVPSAERKLTDLAREQPDSAEINYYLGVAHLRAGHLEQARGSLESALKIAPDTAAAWKTLGMVYVAAGKTEAAVRPFQRACDLLPDDEDACYYLGRNLFALNRYDLARAPLETALHSASRDSVWRVYRALALNYDALARPKDAERHFRESIKANHGQAPPDQDPRIDYGAFLFRQGRTEDALAPLQEAVAALPSNARSRTELGRVLLQLGRLKDAATHLEKATALDPRDWPAHLLLGRAYLRLGRAEEGEREMRIAQEGLAGQGSGSSMSR
jgi:Flp pilus assembly protein TadD